VILREFRAGGSDPAILGSFACSTGLVFEDEVEEWIRTAAINWANDIPRATFQRRVVATLHDDARNTAAVVAWQDIVRVDIEGIWLEVLAVGLDHQHRGTGREVLEMTIAHLRNVDRDGDHLVGLVHPDNVRSQRLLSGVGLNSIAVLDGHQLWVGSL
jgi:RimJ/RimL family protein N-acetyltransferase